MPIADTSWTLSRNTEYASALRVSLCKSMRLITLCTILICKATELTCMTVDPISSR